MAFFEINGKPFPYPAVGLQMQGQQLVDSKRNASGQVVAQKINRRLTKFNNLKWAYLTAQQWHDIQVEIEKFECEVKFWDNLEQKFVTRKFYWGDYSADVFKINPDTGEVLSYLNCTCNLIDMGY